jgi:hypothetical protein
MPEHVLKLLGHLRGFSLVIMCAEHLIAVFLISDEMFEHRLSQESVHLFFRAVKSTNSSVERVGA